MAEVNKGILDEYLLNPIKLIEMAHNFIKRTIHGLNIEVSMKICDGELELEKI
jgi:hypothetical protein